MIPYASALKIYAKRHGGAFVVPKKGSEAYEAVKKIQQETEMSEEYALKRKPKITKGLPKSASLTAFAEPGGKSQSVGFGVKGVPEGKPAPTAAGGASRATTADGDSLVPPRATTTELNANQKKRETKKIVANAEAVPEGAPKKNLSRTGRTVKGDAQDFIENENTGMSAVVSAQFADQKDQIEKALKKNKKTPKIVTVGEGQEKTLENMKTDDPKAIEGKAPFSISALRMKLLA